MMRVTNIGQLTTIESWDDAHPLGFTNANGAAADPTTVTLVLTKPDRTTNAYTWALDQVKRESIGKFYYDLIPDQSGTWYYEWRGTGAVQAVDPGQFIVRYQFVGVPS